MKYEIAGSKKCLADHGINSTVIVTTHGYARNNGTIINEIGKYYDLVVNGFDKLMFLHCTGTAKYSNQTDCRTYFSNGTLTFVNKNSIREHNNIDKVNSYNDSKTFKIFIDEGNNQQKYNRVGTCVGYIRIR